MSRVKLWVLRASVALAAVAPWAPKLVDRVGHLLDLGCGGMH